MYKRGVFVVVLVLFCFSFVSAGCVVNLKNLDNENVITCSNSAGNLPTQTDLQKCVYEDSSACFFLTSCSCPVNSSIVDSNNPMVFSDCNFEEYIASGDGRTLNRNNLPGDVSKCPVVDEKSVNLVDCTHIVNDPDAGPYPSLGGPNGDFYVNESDCKAGKYVENYANHEPGYIQNSPLILGWPGQGDPATTRVCHPVYSNGKYSQCFEEDNGTLVRIMDVGDCNRNGEVGIKNLTLSGGKSATNSVICLLDGDAYDEEIYDQLNVHFDITTPVKSFSVDKSVKKDCHSLVGGFFQCIVEIDSMLAKSGQLVGCNATLSRNGRFCNTTGKSLLISSCLPGTYNLGSFNLGVDMNSVDWGIISGGVSGTLTLDSATDTNGQVSFVGDVKIKKVPRSVFNKIKLLGSGKIYKQLVLQDVSGKDIDVLATLFDPLLNNTKEEYIDGTATLSSKMNSDGTFTILIESNINKYFKDGSKKLIKYPSLGPFHIKQLSTLVAYESEQKNKVLLEIKGEDITPNKEIKTIEDQGFPKEDSFSYKENRNTGVIDYRADVNPIPWPFPFNNVIIWLNIGYSPADEDIHELLQCVDKNNQQTPLDELVLKWENNELSLQEIMIEIRLLFG